MDSKKKGNTQYGAEGKKNPVKGNLSAGTGGKANLVPLGNGGANVHARKASGGIDDNTMHIKLIDNKERGSGSGSVHPTGAQGSGGGHHHPKGTQGSGGGSVHAKGIQESRGGPKGTQGRGGGSVPKGTQGRN